MQKYVFIIVIIGFIAGAVIGCTAAKQEPVVAVENGIDFQVVVGQNEKGKPVFMRYDVNSGESWTWVPGGTTHWVPLGESP